MAKIGRNQPCPCGSGKKYKHCCGNPLLPQNNIAFAKTQALAMVKELEAKEQNRIQQQGYGKPIISTNFHDHKIVAVGNTIHLSKKWVYFPDFLMDYIKKKIGED